MMLDKILNALESAEATHNPILTKRIVAAGGDIIEVNAGMVRVNGIVKNITLFRINPIMVLLHGRTCWLRKSLIASQKASSLLWEII